MKARHKIAAALIAMGIACVGTLGYWYLGYEQRVELARFQTGFAEGLRLGASQERRKLINEMDCFGMVEEIHGHGQSLLCSVPVTQAEIENGAVALGSDLEQ